MSAIDDLIKLVCEDCGPFTLVVVNAAEAEVDALRQRVKELEGERNKIANSIKITLDDGTAPDNLADHVSLLMLQEYYPMREEIERLKSQP